MSVRVKVRHNRLDEISKALPTFVDAAIQKFIMDIIALADAETPVDTGHLKNNKIIDIQHLRAVLVWAASYALFVHEGTRYLPARPFALDAFNQALPAMLAALDDLERRL